MPYTFVGMVEAGAGKPQAFLAKGDALFIFAAGDLLDNQSYRVESLSPSQIVMTYVPLNIQQIIDASRGTK